jgi:hypothetical protein
MRKDPLRKLYVHVGLVLVLLSVALVFSLLYMRLPPSQMPTGMVLVEYPDLGIAEGIKSFSASVKSSPDKDMIMLLMYTLWVVIVGAIAMAVHERKRKQF